MACMKRARDFARGSVSDWWRSMRSKLVGTRNLCAAAEAIENLRDCQSTNSAPCLLIDGIAGTGKTSSAKMLAKQYGGVYFSACELETAHSLLSGLLNALVGWRVEQLHSYTLRQRLLDELEGNGWPLIFLDEVDRLDRNRNGVNLLELVRDLIDHGRSPVIMFSIARLARRLANPTGYGAALSSRIVAHLRFERASLDDARLLASELLESVSFDDGLLADLLAVSGGSMRPLMRLFGEAEALARAAKISLLSAAKFKQLAQFAGRPALAVVTPARGEKSREAGARLSDVA